MDCCHLFEDEMNKETKFGDKLSVQLNKHERPLIMFGHDECIFKQCNVTTKSWKNPRGETILKLTDDGQGIMIETFWFWNGIDGWATHQSQ